MLEKFQRMLENLKKEKEEELMEFNLDTVQDYFKMQDVNKWLRFNAMNEEQLKQADRFEEHLKSVLRKLYVPSYQTRDV